MKEVFSELIERYEVKRSEFIHGTWPKRAWWREIIWFSESPKAEECFDQEMELYRQFEADLDDIPRLRNKAVQMTQWGEIVHFLKIHNERLSSSVDNSTTVTGLFVFLGSLFLIGAKYVSFIFGIPFCLVAFAAFQVFLQRMDKRYELSRNKEMLVIIEAYVKKKQISDG